uniref:BRI1-KD interacting protein n=1 Tax=Phaseolus vulgaris TaxID=3885 RepID=T2DLB0_PHAVU|nr:BRI1-KD interacting protein [Phaseolus vulgaris]
MQLMDMSSDDNFVSNLGRTFSESLHIQDAQKSVHVPQGNDICSESEENLCGAINKQETSVNMMCLKKSATFPTPNTILPSSSSDEEANTAVTDSLSGDFAHQTYSRSISLPAPLKLVSAMKGSREKHGVSQGKLNVKWAPDVYDPVPTLLSHTVRSNKKQQKSRKKKPEKKNGKKGQKGNSSRGGSSKDKQFRKLSGTSGLCYKSMDSCDKVFVAATELDALDVRSQDSNCGTSFLKKSVTEMHYSVAEAL